MTHDHLKTMGKIPLNQDRTTTTTTTTTVKNQQIRKSGSYTFVQHIRSKFQNYNVLFSRSYCIQFLGKKWIYCGQTWSIKIMINI